MYELLSDRFIYIPIVILMMTGLYIIVATGNLVKRMVGLSIFQTSIGFLYIAMSKVLGGQPPIFADSHGYESGDGYGADHGGDHAGDYADGAAYVTAEAGEGADASADLAADAAAAAAEQVAEYVDEYGAEAAQQAAEVIYSNPLPHVLILTAIVVGVATLAVGLALVVRIREAYGTIEDDALNAADYSVESGGGA